MEPKKLFCSFMLICFFMSGILNAQSKSKGTLMGRITGSGDNVALPYATVLVAGTNNGASTDMSGNYIIRNIEIGKQTIFVSFLGYEPRNIDVDIKPGVINKLDVTLTVSTIKGEEIIVTAQRAGQQDAINQQLNSQTIVDIVSPDRIRENPDANAAEAIGRLPGVSLIRSGGEGVGLVIRGLDSKYSTVSLNGVQLPSTSLSDRGTSISGISQYLLEGVAVYKSISADMEGNSVAGSVDLTLAPAEGKLKYSVIAQGGYNKLNDYWGNYKLEGDVSNRFFDNMLGVRFSLDAENVNRGRQTMSAAYDISSNKYSGLYYEPVYLINAVLNDISQLINKQAATLVLDGNPTANTKIMLYNFFSNSGGSYTNVNKTYTPLSAILDYNIDQRNSGRNLLYSSSLRVEHTFDWLDVDYGAAFSQTHSYEPNQRTWQFRLDNAFDEKYRDSSITRSLTPSQIVNLSNDNASASSLNQIYLFNMGSNSSDLMQKNRTLYYDFKIPFKFGDALSGHIKTGGKYKYDTRVVDFMMANQFAATNPKMGKYISDTDYWLEMNGAKITASPFYDHTVGNFLNNQYNFGWYPNLTRLNQIWDAWNDFSTKLIAKGIDSVLNTLGAPTRVGFIPDYYGSSIHNQSISEKYFANYILAQIDYSDVFMILPGVRYERVVDDMLGNFVYNLSQSYTLDFPRTYVSAHREDEFWLPMIQMKIKPAEWLQIHASYTKTLGRPSYEQMIPNTFVNKGLKPYIYQAGNPNLRPEQWSSYDIQVSLFGNELGLFSVDGFYKEAKDLIWTRSYTRIKGDPLVPGFPDIEQVKVYQTINNQYKTFIKGLEFSWQTNFWYLPMPFKYFSLNVNYTAMKSETKYPVQRLYTTYQYVSGRPVATVVRVDSVAANSLINQPSDMANVSLGFNYKGLNLWLSYMYNGSILKDWNIQRELVGLQSSYQKWDLQISQKLPLEGLTILFNISNINNAEQISAQPSDSRPTYTEQYGWTSDFGINYAF